MHLVIHYTLPLKGRELISAQIEMGSHLGFSSCVLNPVALRHGDARQPRWSYSDSHFGTVTTQDVENVYLWKLEYSIYINSIVQHELNCIRKYIC